MRARPSRTKAKTGWMLIALGVTLGVGALVGLRGDQPRAPESDTVSHGRRITEERVLIVSRTADQAISQPGEPLRAMLTGGDLPSMTTTATVMTDEDCAPDGDGVSHCTNRIRLEGGAEIVVAHPHRMADVPCLAPGERIVVQAA